MKEVLVEKFDGAVMSAIVGDRVTLDESKAIQLAASIKERTGSMATKVDRAAVLRDELDKLNGEIAVVAPTLEADTAESKTLIFHYVTLCRKNNRAVPAELEAFVAELETPFDDAPTAAGLISDDTPSA